MRWALAALASTLGACAPIMLPPPPAPERGAAPTKEELREPVPGQGKAALDVPGERAQVLEITSRSQGFVHQGKAQVTATFVATRPLCLTPCVADLTYGTHELVFESTTDPERGSEATIEVGRDPLVVHHAMGERHAHPGWVIVGLASLVLGGTSMTLGGTFALVGTSSRGGELQTPGVVLLGAGAGLIGLGIVSLLEGRQEIRPGATTIWTMPRDGANSQGEAR